MNEAAPYVAIAVSVVTFLAVIGEKLWGGGNALAVKFSTLDKETTKAIAVLREDLNSKIDEYEKVATVGFDAIRANIHAMQIGLLEFRAKMSDDLHMYIRKDDYNAGLSDMRRDMRDGFKTVDTRLGEMQDLIMWSNPDAPNKLQKGRG